MWGVGSRCESGMWGLFAFSLDTLLDLVLGGLDWKCEVFKLNKALACAWTLE